MEFLSQTGVIWIIAIQSLGDWLEGPMKFFLFSVWRISSSLFCPSFIGAWIQDGDSK
jgi:hypothetical protein